MMFVSQVRHEGMMRNVCMTQQMSWMAPKVLQAENVRGRQGRSRT